VVKDADRIDRPSKTFHFRDVEIMSHVIVSFSKRMQPPEEEFLPEQAD